MSSQSSGSKWVAGLLIVAIAVVIGVFVYREKQAREPVSGPPSAVAGSASSAQPMDVHDAALPQHPIDGPAQASTASLPQLDQSDDEVLAGLMALTSDGALKSVLRSDAIVSRMVATIDALPKQSVGMNVVPLRTPTGRFQVISDDGNFVASKKNADRYATYMYVADRINPKTAATWYKRNYPLFQQAYRDLGTNGYFNDRLVEVIDHLLAAPEPKGNQQLIPAKEGYVYANAALEQLSVGQKFMIRLGPENEAKIKAKLRALRDDVAAQSDATESPTP